MTTTASTPPLTPEEAKPHAMDLLIDLGDVIGDKPGIQAAINQTVDEHPHDWPLVLASALGWLFAEHTRPDPEIPTRRGAA